ncbi:DUF6456 domain-containing protein [Methylobacterium sp. J-076]|uniref:DUF6456 domain-containing protein n=1 Tax=Methylobacterium sp. J-076 TaxID=2836655 RepID=UPI001FBAF1AD|nr:DUF6456 domain-containing protein [Methylobacterium sp. J-076]MCJ2012070.1 DUF6456 domain-containing protein [Methylobacterium sp. J-076]
MNMSDDVKVARPRQRRARRAEPAARATHQGARILSRDASRLLAALGAPGTEARPDPLDAAALIVRRSEGGVSVGGGRFPRLAGTELVAADLVSEEGAGRLIVSAPGLARLRRERGGEVGPFRAQHLELVKGRGSEEPLRDAGESPLAWMARRRDRDGRPMIDPVEYEAGERLRRDIAQALMLPKMGMDWTAQRVDGGGARDPASASDTAVAARQRVRGALAAVGGDLSDLLLDLCGFLKGLERIEAERRWPARSAKVVARIALSRLAEHYGLERQAVGPERARLRLWREGA